MVQVASPGPASPNSQYTVGKNAFPTSVSLDGHLNLIKQWPHSDETGWGVINGCETG